MTTDHALRAQQAIIELALDIMSQNSASAMRAAQFEQSLRDLEILEQALHVMETLGSNKYGGNK